MAFDQDTQQRFKLALQKGMSEQDALQGAQLYQQEKDATSTEQSSKFALSDLLPALGGIIGGTGGALVGGPVGAVGGGVGGSALGETLRQALTGKRTGIGNIAKEAAFGLAGGVGGEALGAGLRVGGRLLARPATQAATKATTTGISRALGRAAETGGENIALRGIRPTKTQLFKFSEQTGEDLGAFIRRAGLTGQKADAYEEAIRPLQSRFTEAIKRNAAKGSQATLKKEFQTIAQELVSSADKEDVAIGKELLAEYKRLNKRFKTQGYDLTEINKARQQIEAKVDYKRIANEPVEYGAKKLVADALRQTVQGSVKDENLKQLGLELNKYYRAQDIANLQEHLGRGTLPIGLSKLLGIGGGAATIGGLPGAAAGLVATSVGNNPRVLGALAKGATGLGERLQAPLSQGAVVSSQLGGQAVSQNAIRALLGGGQPDETQGFEELAPETDLAGLQPETTEEEGLSDEELALVLITDLAQNKGKNIPLIKSIAPLLQGTKGKESKLSDTAIKRVNELDTAVDSLGELQQTLSANKGFTGPIGGLQTISPYSGARKVQADIDRVRQIVGKALEGGVLRKEDEEKYKRILPTIRDTPEVAQYKINSLMRRLELDREDYLSLQASQGGQAENLLNLLGSSGQSEEE